MFKSKVIPITLSIVIIFISSWVFAADNPLGTTLNARLTGTSPYTNEGVIQVLNDYAINSSQAGDYINNSGTITTGSSPSVLSSGANTQIINTGTIEHSYSSSDGMVIEARGDNITITNSGGLISGAGLNNRVIKTRANNPTIINTESGIINLYGNATTNFAVMLDALLTGYPGTGGYIENRGTISARSTNSRVYGISSFNHDASIINLGTVEVTEAHFGGAGVYLGGNGNFFSNSGDVTISGTGGTFFQGVLVAGRNASVINTGNILSSHDGLNVAYFTNNLSQVVHGLIDELTNLGNISAGAGYYGIRNLETITTLNNSQRDLSYYGNLPTNYNIVINDSSHYGRLIVSSPALSTTFLISSLSNSNIGIAGTRYQNVLSGVSSSNISNENTVLTYQNGNLLATYSLVADDSSATNVWDLLILSYLNGPTATDTQASLTPNAYALRGAYILQSAIINTGLTYDCTTFDKNGICVSAGGRVTDTNNPSTNSQGALLIASYRANEQWRVGAYLDQNLSSNDARGVNLDNNNPMGGLFAVWNQNTDGTGYQVRLASGYSDKDLTISRSAFGATGEAGKGDSSLQSQAYSATLSRGFQLNNTRWIASPYLGVRYTKIKRAGYTEDTDISAPLTYSALSQETTTALVGVRFNGQLGDKINLMASAGIENDIAHNTGDYAATGVDGLTPIAFNQNIRHIRPVASAGASYAIDKRQTVGANLNFRQETFNSTNSVSGMVTYQVGF